MGYGIRYEFGIFRQEIEDGWQVEQPDEWLHKGNPWEIARPEYTVEVPYGGQVEQWTDEQGTFQVRWVPEAFVLGLPYDTPVAGFGRDNHTVNTLRLWSARASEEFDLEVFNDGDYRRAVEGKALDESISKVLYPKDDSVLGKELRLRQQFFFVCCSIHDLVRRYKRDHDTFDAFPERVAIQLNDTHPSIAVAELMRVLVDRERLEWDDAWAITTRTLAYTNHTLLPEALEKWSVDMFARILPRHLQIIQEIDRRHLREVHVRAPWDDDLKRRVAIVADGQVHMAHLSVVGSHHVNGVAELHSQLLKDRVLHDFATLYPERFTNQTNGVTPRRWVLQCNPRLSAAITERIGPDWVTDLSRLSGLEPYVDDPDFLGQLASIKQANKEDLAVWMQARHGMTIDPTSLFDVQVKRIHEYKRQLMCCLHVVWLYWRLKHEGEDIVPRTVLIGGKAAPGYARAKEHIKLINDLAGLIDRDPDCHGRLRLHFLPNYNVSAAQRVIPASDLSEQISMAGKEASGTGNMKFQMNGALTIGTLDGANVEIREEVGEDSFFLFGQDAEQVRQTLSAGWNPARAIEGSERLQVALDLLESGVLDPDERELHHEVATYLRTWDPYLVCADFDDYVETQERVSAAWSDPARWWPMVARNIARSGKFSSDRTITGYASEIWGLTPCHIDLSILDGDDDL
jgi:starch phosphorylase